MAMKGRAKRRPVRPAPIARAVDEGRESLDLYLDEISRVPLLSREEEMELARKAFRGSVAAQEKLARHNVRFVVSVAKKFQNRGVPLVDLIGRLGVKLDQLLITNNSSAATGLTFERSLALSIAGLTTTGPAIATLGEGLLYRELSAAARAIFCFAMIVGRMEALVLIALFNPAYWRQ